MSYDSVVLADSPVAFWKLNDTSGPNAVDATGNGHTGTYTGTFTLNQTGIGDGETAVLLDGSSGYVSVPAAAPLHPAQPTGEVWVYPTATQDGSGFLCSNAYTTGVGFELGYDVGGAGPNTTFGSFDGAWHIVQAASTLSLNTWHHIVGTYDGVNFTLYIDGVGLTPTGATVTPVYDNTELRIGLRHDLLLSPYFPGMVAKAAVYNYALTSAQVAAHFAAQIAPVAPVAFQSPRRMPLGV